jgi:hypothetical protein
MDRPASSWRPAALACTLLLLLPDRLTAQDSSSTSAGPCPADTTAVSRVCQAGADALTAFLPVEGLLVSGGNPVPGTAGGIGKFGHVRIGARVGFARVTLPSAGYDGSTDTVAADKRLLVPVPRIDLSLGLLSKTLKLGTVTVDLLGSAVVIPTGATTRVRVDENARSIAGLALGLGFGLRLGMAMPEPKPTISLSLMKRDMPGIRFGDRSAGDRLSAATTLSAINVRLLVGGRLKLVTLAAGGGLDLDQGSGSVTYADSAGADSTVTMDLSTSRIMTALNAGLDLGPLKLWAEGGFQVGRKTELVTRFERNDPSSGRFFGGVGAAIQF